MLKISLIIVSAILIISSLCRLLYAELLNSVKEIESEDEE